jgi:hypothetical protein
MRMMFISALRKARRPSFTEDISVDHARFNEAERRNEDPYL